jgi:hypothetical protein
LAGSTRQLIVVNRQSYEHIVVLDHDHVQEVLTHLHASMQRDVLFDFASLRPWKRAFDPWLQQVPKMKPCALTQLLCVLGWDDLCLR